MNDFSNYANTKKFIVNLGLKRITTLLNFLDNPQEKVKIIHVAGTNGKGSVCAFVKAILISAGYKTGSFSSPELINTRERISVNNINISEKDLNMLLEKVQDASQRVFDTIGEYPSPFEIWTACAYLYFHLSKCDYAVVEVGMGGLEDATNVIKKPVLSVITSISIDHTEFLGSTLSIIAAKKCGIIKPKCPVVTTRQVPSVMDVITSSCKEHASPLYVTSPPPSYPDSIYEVIVFSSQKVKLSLGGLNQCENAAIAIECARLLNVSDEHIITGLTSACHKARFEKLSDKPIIIFDGAHNPDGATSLSHNISRYFGKEKFVFVYAAMADKDISSVINTLSPHAVEFVFTSVSDNSRSAQKKDYDAACPRVKSSYYPVLTEALSYAKATGDNIIITGSLYLYKDLFI